MIKTIRKTSAVDEVFQYLHSRIVSGELPKGHRFPPQEIMAGELGVSRSTIREALNKLSLLGMLTAKPGVGTMVAGHDASAFVSHMGQYIFLASEEVGQFMEGRLYLEKAAVRLAVLRAVPADVRRLEKLLDEQGAALDDSALFSRLDAQFHRSFVEISRNRLLSQFMDLIWEGLYQLIKEVTTLKEAAVNALRFHSRMLKHLADRDADLIERALMEHLCDVVRNIERNLGQNIGLDDLLRLESARPPAGEAPRRNAQLRSQA